MQEGAKPEQEGKEAKPEEAPPAAKKEIILAPNTIIKNKWKVSGKIGQGAFGETYSGYDLNSTENNQVAIKVERWDNKKMVLKLEVVALKKLQTCPYVVKYISSGRQEDFNFLVMERLGENLAELRKKTPSGFFSLGTALRLGSQMLDAIEGCHKLAYIHRDIKPSNFVMGKPGDGKPKRCYLIDFGLARKYRMPGGEIRPARKTAGFRGTARYASINSHQSKELSRRDDLWSLFYVLVEFASGQLPWRKIKDKDDIGVLKEKHTNVDLVKDLPQQFRLFMEHLQTLGYPSNPDYNLLRGYLNEMLENEGVTPTMPYDWELDKPKHTGSRPKPNSGKIRDNKKTSPHAHPVLSPALGPKVETMPHPVVPPTGGIHVESDVYENSQDQAASQHTGDNHIAASKQKDSFNESDNEDDGGKPHHATPDKHDDEGNRNNPNGEHAPQRDAPNNARGSNTNAVPISHNSIGLGGPVGGGGRIDAQQQPPARTSVVPPHTGTPTTTPHQRHGQNCSAEGSNVGTMPPANRKKQGCKCIIM
eukprot:TRINITY_DN54196_c0_g1_i1.p1 TRINITY_DN54196_c0_g1~~TRINITY_DN54196_c0_g1_i1.p1  ORF type:complete len:546 (+),score=59.74 TRINITY_DN54196_c0_g1_i1:37-1638(+)